MGCWKKWKQSAEKIGKGKKWTLRVYLSEFHAYNATLKYGLAWRVISPTRVCPHLHVRPVTWIVRGMIQHMVHLKRILVLALLFKYATEMPKFSEPFTRYPLFFQKVENVWDYIYSNWFGRNEYRGPYNQFEEVMNGCCGEGTTCRHRRGKLLVPTLPPLHSHYGIPLYLAWS